MTTSPTHLMGNTSVNPLTQNDIAYFQQRQRNRVFQEVLRHFANCAANEHITKKHLAEKLGKDPSQITRWFAGPTNWTLDTISDLLLAMDAEMDFTIVPFTERQVSNYFHPVMSEATSFHPRSITYSGSSSSGSSSLTSASIAPMQVIVQKNVQP